MSVGLLDTTFPVDPRNPLNRAHRLNAGRTTWLLAQPATTGGKKFPDLTGRVDGLLNVGGANPPGWVSDARPGGGISVRVQSGNGNFVDWFNNLATVFFTASTMTVSIWFRYLDAPLTNANSYALPTIIGDFSRNGFVGLHVGISNGNDRVWAYVWDGAKKEVGGVYTRNVWCRAMMVHAGGNLTLYINGVSAGTVAAGNITTLNFWEIGDAGTSDNFQFDDVAIWNRGLSASEAMEDYQESLAGYPNVLNRVTPLGMLALAPQSGFTKLAGRGGLVTGLAGSGGGLAA